MPAEHGLVLRRGPLLALPRRLYLSIWVLLVQKRDRSRLVAAAAPHARRSHPDRSSDTGAAHGDSDPAGRDPDPAAGRARGADGPKRGADLGHQHHRDVGALDGRDVLHGGLLEDERRSVGSGGEHAGHLVHGAGPLAGRHVLLRRLRIEPVRPVSAQCAGGEEDPPHVMAERGRVAFAPTNNALQRTRFARR